MQYVVLVFGVFACATSVVFIRASETDPVLLSAYRLLIAGVFLFPLTLRAWRQNPLPLNRGYFARIVPPAFFLALHFATWIYGARLTPSANATLIVNMVPVAMPFLLYFQLGERINRPEGWGTAVAFAGVFLLGVADFNYSRTHALGDVICFLSMLLYAVYLVAARRNRDLPSVYLYIVPVYLLSGVFCFIFLVFMVPVSGGWPAWIGPRLGLELVCIFGLGVVPTVLGHSILAWALRHMRGQVVAVINLGQFLFAGFLAFLLLDEVPQPLFYLAAAGVVAGAAIVIRYRQRA